MTDTANLGLPFIMGSQAQKHITHNEALRVLDAVIQIAVQDTTRTVPPLAPIEGHRHIVASGATDTWAGHDHALAAFEDGAWRFVTPNVGWCAWSIDDDVLFVFDGAVWRDQRNLPVGLENLTRLGVNTTAAAPNLFSVKSNAALITAIPASEGGSGDARLQISKETAANTASVFFSGAYSGRAEFGLTGDDVFALKTSPDGVSWHEALSIAPESGLCAMPLDALARGGMQLNGGMDISQEHGNNAVTLTASGALQSKYLVDCVRADYRGGFVAVAQQATSPFPGTAKALRIGVVTAQTSLGATDELSVVLPIEGTRVARLGFGLGGASPLAIGFWFSAHRPGIYSGAVRNGAKNRSYPFSFTVAAADTRQWISLAGIGAIPGDNAGNWAKDTNLGLSVSICLAAGTSRIGAQGAWASADYSGANTTANGVAATTDEFYISNVLAVPGLHLPTSETAPFALRHADDELPLCLRYFERHSDGILAQGRAVSTTSAYLTMLYAAKRAVPTVKVNNLTSFHLYNAGGSSIVVTSLTGPFNTSSRSTLLVFGVSGGLVLGYGTELYPTTGASIDISAVF